MVECVYNTKQTIPASRERHGEEDDKCLHNSSLSRYFIRENPSKLNPRFPLQHAYARRCALKRALPWYFPLPFSVSPCLRGLRG